MEDVRQLGRRVIENITRVNVGKWAGIRLTGAGSRPGYPESGQSWAALEGRSYVLPDGVRAVAARAYRLIRLGWPESGSAPASAIVTELLDRVPGATAPSGRGALMWDSGRR